MTTIEELEKRVEKAEAIATGCAAMTLALTMLLKQRGVLNELEVRVVLAASVELAKDPTKPKDMEGLLRWAAKTVGR